MGFRELLRAAVTLLPLLAVIDCQSSDLCIFTDYSAYCEERDLPDVPHYLPETIKVLYFRRNKVILNFNTFDHLPNLEQIFLDGNGITSIPEDLFRNLPNLTAVSLYENKLDTLPVNIFQYNPLIHRLDVSVNQLKDVNILFENTNLKELFAHFNALESMPKSEIINEKIYALDLSYNSLESLDPQLFASIKDCSVWIANNPWHCDCATSDLIKVFRNQNISVQVDPVCVSPAKYAGTKWSELPDLCV